MYIYLKYRYNTYTKTTNINLYQVNDSKIIQIYCVGKNVKRTEHVFFHNLRTKVSMKITRCSVYNKRIIFSPFNVKTSFFFFQNKNSDRILKIY